MRKFVYLHLSADGKYYGQLEGLAGEQQGWVEMTPEEWAFYKPLGKTYGQQGNTWSIPGMGTTAPGAGGAGTVIPGAIEDIYDPFSAFLAQQGLAGKAFYNPAEQYRVAQYDPLKTSFDIRQRMSLVPGLESYGTTTPGFLDYAGVYGGDVVERARNTLAGIFGATTAQREAAGTTYEPTWTGEGGVTQATGAMTELAELLKAVFRGRVAAPAAKFAVGRLPELQQGWMAAQPATGGVGGETFLDYLRKQYPI